MIYICIPTHNEQQTVGVVLWKLRQVLTEYPRDYQLLVADDASTDRTQDVLEPYTRVLPLTVIRSERQQGHAASLEMLLREAARRSEYPKRDIVVTLQADFSEEPDDLVALLKRMEAGADVAVGTKVTTRKQTAMRRIARKLSGLFVRGQQWPEGMVHPFDGYRAYRLYAVKKAMEEREGRRLLRYDSWACHAELLRAVLPHARRVDVVEVDDRSDRKQRPSREKPLAAAMQVRAMMRNAEPGGLISVAELDRLAATASRARERTAANGNGRRTSVDGNGRDGRSRDRARGEGRREEGRTRRTGEGRSRSGEGRDRAEGRSRSGESRRGRPEGERKERPPRGEGRERQGQDGSRQERQERPRRERQPRQRRDAEGAQPTAAAEEGVSATTEEQLQPGMTPEGAVAGEAGEAGGDGAAPRKRRRRRRGRGGSKRSAEAAAEGATESDAEAPSGKGADGPDSDGNDGDAGDAGEPGGERKRRRRGGRRGGRRRRRSAGPEGSGADEGGNAENGNGSAEGGAPASAGAGREPDARSDQE